MILFNHCRWNKNENQSLNVFSWLGISVLRSFFIKSLPHIMVTHLFESVFCCVWVVNQKGQGGQENSEFPLPPLSSHCARCPGDLTPASVKSGLFSQLISQFCLENQVIWICFVLYMFYTSQILGDIERKRIHIQSHQCWAPSATATTSSKKTSGNWKDASRDPQSQVFQFPNRSENPGRLPGFRKPKMDGGFVWRFDKEDFQGSSRLVSRGRTNNEAFYRKKNWGNRHITCRS